MISANILLLSQRRIRGAAEQVDHATAGAAECAKTNELYAAFAVMGHHRGLPDGGSRTDSIDSPTFSGGLQRAAKGKLADYSAWQGEIHLPKAAPPLINQGDTKETMFFIRMLYSCLTDADFLDTEEFMDGQRPKSYADSIETLAEKLDHFVKAGSRLKHLSTSRDALSSDNASSRGIYSIPVSFP